MSAHQVITEDQLKKRAEAFLNDPFIKMCRKQIAKIMERAMPQYIIEKGSNCIKVIYSDEVRRLIKRYEEEITDRIKNEYSDIINQINF